MVSQCAKLFVFLLLFAEVPFALTWRISRGRNCPRTKREAAKNGQTHQMLLPWNHKSKLCIFFLMSAEGLLH